MMGIKIEQLFFIKCKLLFSLIILLATCPLWGQVNNNMKVHLEGNEVFFALDDSLLNKEMLFVRHGTGYKQVIWSKHMDYILLEIPRINSLSGIILPINNSPSVENNVIAAFPIIKGKSDSKTHYINVTNLFLKNIMEWYSGFKEPVMADLTLILEVKQLDNEVVVRTRRILSNNATKSKAILVFSFFILPEPMAPRLFDYRMGYSVEDENSFINHSPKSEKASITRWRLEKKDKDKKISDPIKPITFYFDDKIPGKWKPYIKAGILEWAVAFENAGYRNAIQVKDAPVDNIHWDIHSVNNAIIRWSNNTGVRGFEDNYGSTVNNIIDLRTGEILKSDIIIGSSYESLAAEYIVRCAPLDTRAQQYPLPNDLIGELIQSVVAHEAGHAFGIKDANYGEYAYPFNKMRNKHWLKKMGHTPSIMTYARHNYIPQPEDSISPSLLIQKVGPTDVYQIKWGYQKFENIKAPQDELPFLEKLIRQQDTIAWYRYNIGQYEQIGPASGDEVVDNNDPIKSTLLGLKNMKRVIELLPEITKHEKDYDLLERLYYKTFTLWFNEMKQVMSLVGGYTIHYKSVNQKGDIYTPIPLKVQEDAMDFLMLNAFDPPKWLINPKFKSKTSYSTTSDIAIDFQLKLLTELLKAKRMQRVLKMEDSNLYKGVLGRLMSKIQATLFYELTKKTVVINRHKQEMQNAYITHLVKAIEEEKKYEYIMPDWNYYLYSDYTKSIFISELLSLKVRINEHLNNVKERSTQAHLVFCLVQIDKVLKP